jgi:nucleoside-diphosphate-sugar epimerase
MKHLILGSSGQIGFHLLSYLKSIGEETVEFDIVKDTCQDLRIYNNSLLESSIKDCDFVHFLAFGFIDNNIKIMDRTFALLKKYNKPFIFASSQMSNMNYSTYGILKAIGEKYTESLKGLVVKFWNVYGYEQDEEKSHVITDFIKMAKLGKIQMRTTGTEVRQFLYGDDCSKCLFTLSKFYNKIDRNKELHITNFEWTSIEEIASIIKKEIKCEIIPGIKEDNIQRDKRNEPNDYILNYWKPTTSLKKGIKEIINLMKNT